MSHPKLWSEADLPSHAARPAGKDFKSLRFPLWTQNKARLIATYLRLFVMITKHGTYIDGFAAPQEESLPETWAAKLVLEIEPKWFRDFWLCDISSKGIAALKELSGAHATPKRHITVLDGDFNDRVHDVLRSGKINEKTATFALLDQRTFECQWRTVQSISRHKTGTKIELFYFFATGWIDRSLAAASRPATLQKITQWWGRDDWAGLKGLGGIERAKMFAARFETELGYRRADVYPIHSEQRRGRIMYHMIHATDHPDAFPLMVRAYRKVSGRPDLDEKEEQLDWINMLNEIQQETA